MLAEEDNGNMTSAAQDCVTVSDLAGDNPATKLPTRRIVPPLQRVIYDCFLDVLKNGHRILPTSKQLRKIGYYGTRSICPRQKFRLILPRLDIENVEGSIVFSSKPREDVLVLKRNRKIILPVEDCERAIRRAHFTGLNHGNGDVTDETKRPHFSYKKTLNILAKVFTTQGRNFGINNLQVKEIVNKCRSCALAEISSDDESKKASEIPAVMLNTALKPGMFPCPLAVQNGLPVVQRKILPKPTKYPELPHDARFSSMAAAIPNGQCIWYGREGIARATNRFTKLLLLLNEIRGEMALAVKGDPDAKQRLDTKLFVGQYLIKEYLKNVQNTFNACEDDDDEQTRSHLKSLEEAYREAGQESIFKCDLQSLVSHEKTTLSIPRQLLKQIDNFITTAQSR